MDPAWLLWPAAALLVAAGFAGLVLPLLPGAPLLFAGLLCAAAAEDFLHVGPVTLTVLGAMTLLTYVVDLVAGAFGARRFGASRHALIGAGAGTVIGLFFGLPGVIAGPFLGAVLAELWQRRGIRQAGMAGAGAAFGLAIAAAAKLALAAGMLGVFAVVRFF